MSNEEIEKYNADLARIFGTNLKRIIDAKKISQADLAKILDISESAVGKWTLKKSFPSMGMVEHIAKLLGVNKSELLNEYVENMNVMSDKKDREKSIILLQSLKDEEMVLLSSVGVMADEDKELVLDLVKRLKKNGN